MIEAPEMAIDGVTLAQFAFVRAGLTDGLGLDELLGFVRLDARLWEAAEVAWDEHVLDAIEDDPAFLEALDEATAEARQYWTHRIPPLDEEMRGWFDFLHAWMTHADPVAFLEETKLGVADLAHLHRHWSARLAKDAELRVEAVQILAGERREPPVPAPEKPMLIQKRSASRGGDGMTVAVARARRDALPFAEREPGPLPPPLAVPLPRRPRATAVGPDQTRVGDAQGVEAVLPFMASASFPGAMPVVPVELSPKAPAPPAWVEREETEERAQFPEVTDPDATTAIELPSGRVIPLAEAFERATTTTEPLLSVDAHARLVAELTTGADLAELLARHGLTSEAKQSEDERWARTLNGDPDLRRAWMRAFEAARARLTDAGEKS